MEDFEVLIYLILFFLLLLCIGGFIGGLWENRSFSKVAANLIFLSTIDICKKVKFNFQNLQRVYLLY